MSLVQKWLLGIIALGAGAMVLAKPDAFYTALKGIRNVTAGTVTDVTTGKSPAA